MGFDILTYRKGRIRHIVEKRFTLHKAKLDGRRVEYLLHDQPVRFLNGTLRLRQVTRLTETGHQTPMVTSRWDLRAFIQMALQDTADIEPTDDQLWVRLVPLSSPHRSRVLESLCDALNKTNTLFPGTQLQMHYVVAPPCLEAKSGQVPGKPCQEF